MQLKTIKKRISNKLTEWMDSITDKDLSQELKPNILVSGGSITSMLLNEDVNDYDIYIKDKAVLIRLVKYYTKDTDCEIFEGTDQDRLLKDLLNGFDDFTDDFTSMRKISIENLKEDQVKLFFSSGGGGLKVDIPPKDETEYIPAYFSPNAISLTGDIQIVLRFHGDSTTIHKTFDFIHATNYFTFDEGLVTNKKALESIITKQLFYQGSLYPLTSIIRMKKFIKRNWNISAGEILKIMFQISELDLKNPNVLEEQLIGVDVAYFDTLIKILRGVKSEKITSHYLNSIIDKVFNEYDEEA